MIRCEACNLIIEEYAGMDETGKYWHYPSCPIMKAKVVTCVFKKEYIHHVGDTIEVSVKDYKNLKANGYVELEKLETVLEGMTKEAKEDNINPSHYKSGKVECIDALDSATAKLKGIEAVCTANAIKYLWRWKEKNGVEDLEKAIWYINHMIDRLKS